jgi:hypothetical protein
VLNTGEALDLVTNSIGAFAVDNPMVASYRFSPSLDGSVCKDSVTNATLRFPFSLHAPAVNTTVINAISLLTVPASSDPAVFQAYGGSVTNGHAPAYLWKHAYKLVGYDSQALGVRGWACVVCVRHAADPLHLQRACLAFSASLLAAPGPPLQSPARSPLAPNPRTAQTSAHDRSIS